MSEEPLENSGEIDPIDADAAFAPEEGEQERAPSRRRLPKILLTITFLLFSIVLLGAILVGTGVADRYVRSQFTAKMKKMGMAFESDAFAIRLNPLRLRITNAKFNDKETGEKLIFIKEANIDLTVKDLWALRFGREISIDATDVDGAEIYIRFDENGRSNFSNVRFIEEEDAIKVSFKASKLSIRNSTVDFGDVKKKLSAETKFFSVSVEPADVSVPDDRKRYSFSLAADDAFLAYEQKKIEDIDIRAKGVIDANGAEIEDLSVNSSAGDAKIVGRIDGWESLNYDLKMDSTIDLTRTTDVFPLGTPVKGIGNFSGKISGQGENYKIDGNVSSESLVASNVSLKGLDVTAALEGRDGAYEANGRAIAKMLTFGDFQIDFPQMVGLIRGTGTDFKWLGALQAAAAKTKSGTIGGLFISDAVAENNEKRFVSAFGRTRAKYYSLDDLFISDIEVGDLKIASGGGLTEISAPGATATGLKTRDIQLGPLTAGRVDIRDKGDTVDIETPKLTSRSGRIGDFDFKDLSSDNVVIKSRRGVTDITADNLVSQSIVASNAKFGTVSANGLTIQDTDQGLVAIATEMAVARLESDAAILGNVNIGGVRFSIRQGTVEFKSDDFSAGDAELPKNSVFAAGGRLSDVKVVRPVFVLEGSGSYRATADMTLGGGVIGSVKLGSAKGFLTVTNDAVSLKNLTAAIMDGELKGGAEIALSETGRSRIDVNFTSLDLAKILALEGGSVLPVAGHADGNAFLEFNGTDAKSASGTIVADIKGKTVDGDGMIALTGRIDAEGRNGLFEIKTGHLQTDASSLDAKGSIDLASSRSDMGLRINSTDAKEIERVVRSFDFSPEIRRRIEDYRIELAGALNFAGHVFGNISDPIIDAKASVETLSVRGIALGSLQTGILQSSDIFELKNGVLFETDGGTLAFDLRVPEFGANNATFNAVLNNVNAGNVISALPFEMPKALRELRADTSGELRLTGLPDAMQGDMNLVANRAAIGTETFDRIEARAKFEGTLIKFEKLRTVIGDGYANAIGTYKTDTTDFEIDLEGKKVPLTRLRALLPDSKEIPLFEGIVDVSGRASGRRSDSTTYYLEFDGSGKEITVNSAAVGDIKFNGTTKDRIFDATFQNGDASSGQRIVARIDFSDPKLRFSAESMFNKTSLNPYIASVRPVGNVPITGKATGGIRLEGNLLAPDSKGDMAFSVNGLSGRADFSQFEIQIDQTPLVATEPVAVTLTDDAITFERANFSGGGSNMRIAGTRALTDSVDNNLSIVGRVNLGLINVAGTDTFFAGFADVNVRLNGPNSTARLNGRADMVSASVSTFVSSERVSLERLKGTVIFTSNQAQIENATGVLGGGNVTLSGGALLGDGLRLDAMKFDLRGDNVTVPLPKNFLTTGDAVVSISGRRVNNELLTFISGRINARRSLYTTNIELADVIGQRKDSPLSSSRGPSGYANIGLDLIVEGRDALVVRNNLADLTASLALRVTGDIDTPQVTGRVTANSGTILFRYERYEVQRLELVFPPNTSFEPIINLQAEAEIQGYQVVASLSGSLSDMETLTANVRSNPALPQADVVSLITTGSLANTESGIPTATQSGISAAADILTDEIISKPVSKATDKLFGLNRFEIDPILSGQRLNPTARLTVGRQINRNLLVTYSTNLAQDQNRVLALEYRLSNRLSVVAQYEQRSLANVTQRSNAFSFEIRLRKRF